MTISFHKIFSSPDRCEAMVLKKCLGLVGLTVGGSLMTDPMG